jgi:hypothetical protein
MKLINFALLNYTLLYILDRAFQYSLYVVSIRSAFPLYTVLSFLGKEAGK